MGEVFVVGAASTGPDVVGDTAGLAHDIARAALADAGVRARQISGVFIGSGSSNGANGVEAVAVRLGLRRLGLRSSTPVGDGDAASGRVEYVSESAVQALQAGFRAVESGIDELVVCIGTEQGSANGSPWSTWPPRAALHSRVQAARRYVDATGTTAAQLARVVVKNRAHGALMGAADRVATSDVLDSDVIEWPLTRPMVSACGRGAAAVVLASTAMARAIARDAVRVRASVLVAAPVEGDPATVMRAARIAYADAGLGPDELDIVELHDATAAAELAAYEQLGIAPEGHGGELVDSGFTALGGVLPVNVSGGLLTLGERPGAGAIAQISELTRQLRREAGASQVAAARVGLAHCLGRPGDGFGGVVGVTVMSA